MSSFIYALYLGSLLSKGLKMAHQRKVAATKANNMSLNPRTQVGHGLGVTVCPVTTPQSTTLNTECSPLSL